MPGTGSALLQQVPLFSALSAAELEELVSRLRRRRFAKGQFIFRRDDPGASLFIIEEGIVRIGLTAPDGREVILTLLSAGDYFGELAILDGEPRSADAIALESTVLLSLQRETFLAFLEAHPRAGPLLIAAISRQVRRLTDQVHDAVFLDLQTRLARTLLKLLNPEDLANPATEPSLKLTQAQIGSMVGATRESVNKWLGFYERRGIIHREKGTIILLKTKALEEYASLEAEW